MRTLALWLLLLAAPALADPVLQRGRLVDPDGRRLADREVRLFDWEYHEGGGTTLHQAVGRTDGEGRFAIDIAALGTDRLVRLVVGHRPWGPAGTRRVTGDDWGTLRVPRLPVVAGRAVDARGRPLANAGVRLASSFDPEVFTDADGRFELEMLVGTWRLLFSRGDESLGQTPPLRVVEGQGRIPLEVVLDPERLARIDRAEARGLRLERVGGDPAWGPPWEPLPYAETDDLIPGEYRVLQHEGSAFVGPGTHPLRAWTVTLRPGPCSLAPPPDARLAIPCLVGVDGAPEPGEGRWLRGWSHPLRAPPLDEAAFRRWPIHEVADESNMRYHGELLSLAGVHSDTRALEEARAAAVDRGEEVVEEERADETLVAHLPAPGTWGVTLAAGSAHTGLQVEAAEGARWTTARARWAGPAGGATLALVEPRTESLAYDSALRPLHAVLVDERKVVRWARLLEQLPLTAEGLEPGRYRLLWGYDGFRPREAAVELVAGKTTKVVLDPF